MGSRTEGRKSGGRRLSSVVHTTNHIEIKPVGGGRGGGATRRLITEIKKQDIIVLIQIRSAFVHDHFNTGSMGASNQMYFFVHS